MSNTIEIFGIRDLPEIQSGDDLGVLICEAASQQGTTLVDSDVIVITQKIVSKAEGRIIDLSNITPSPLAVQIASEHERDPRHTEVVLQESKRIVRMNRGVIIAETKHGFICANAGVDASNASGEGTVCLLPLHPDTSADRIKTFIRNTLGIQVAIVISDTFGRPWREGAINVAIGVAGINPLADYRGEQDSHGLELRTTAIAIADELASAGELVMGKLDRVPVAVIRGYSYPDGEDGINSLIRPTEKDLFQ